MILAKTLSALLLAVGAVALAAPAPEFSPGCVDFCRSYKPLPKGDVTTLAIAYNERQYYSRCRRSYPRWLYQLVRELEAGR